MTLNYTPRLGLNKPDQDEFQLVDILNQNMDKLDTQVGVKMVTAGVIPPVNQMYDGLIVNERDTGKTWIASANGTGGFDRAWIRYPWSIDTQSIGYTINNNATVTPPLVGATGGVNSTSADIVGGKIVTPISGIYRVDINAQFGPNTQSDLNWRSIGVELNGSTYDHAAQYLPMPIKSTQHYFQYGSMPLTLAAGTKIAGQMWQNSGLNMPGCLIHVVVTLINVTGKNNN